MHKQWNQKDGGEEKKQNKTNKPWVVQRLQSPERNMGEKKTKKQVSLATWKQQEWSAHTSIHLFSPTMSLLHNIWGQYQHFFFTNLSHGCVSSTQLRWFPCCQSDPETRRHKWKTLQDLAKLYLFFPPYPYPNQGSVKDKKSSMG